MKGESVQMKNAESSINNQVTRTSGQKSLYDIIVQILELQSIKYFISALIISVVGLIFISIYRYT